MAAGLLALAALLGQPSDPSPTAAVPPPAQHECRPTTPGPNSNEVVVCAIRPEGYRIDPDILKAHREARNHTHPKPPENFVDHSCQVVGPAPCINAPMINIIGAATTLAQMADRLAKGQEIGSMFITDPEPSEYQLYLDAKKEREADEAAKAAKAKSDAAKASAK